MKKMLVMVMKEVMIMGMVMIIAILVSMNIVLLPCVFDIPHLLSMSFDMACKAKK